MRFACLVTPADASVLEPLDGLLAHLLLELALEPSREGGGDSEGRRDEGLAAS